MLEFTHFVNVLLFFGTILNNSKMYFPKSMVTIGSRHPSHPDQGGVLADGSSLQVQRHIMVIQTYTPNDP